MLLIYKCPETPQSSDRLKHEGAFTEKRVEEEYEKEAISRDLLEQFRRIRSGKKRKL